MSTVQVTAQQLAQFQEDGYTIFPTFLTPLELAAMLAGFERFKCDRRLRTKD